MFSSGFASLSVLLLFPSNIDEVLSINPSANVLVFGDFNVHHKDWLTYSGGTDRPGELYYNFSISDKLTQMVDFPTRIPDCDSQSLALLIYFFHLMLVFVLPWLSLHWKILIMLSQFPLTFHQIHNGMPHFIVLMAENKLNFDFLVISETCLKLKLFKPYIYTRLVPLMVELCSK